jgi:hypothetical protein
MRTRPVGGWTLRWTFLMSFRITTTQISPPDDPFGQNTIFHSNCRGIWVAILNDEDDKPVIGGIPQSLRNRIGDAANDLIQPKKPQRKRQ